ncbi:kinase-like domain-containing protein, partial [Tribonema minus]
IGAGSQGQVYEATWLGAPVAVKVTWDDGTAEAEAAAHESLRHPNIVALYCASPRMLIMELMRGSLSDFIRGSPEPTSTTKWKMVADVLRAVNYLDHAGAVHGDIKVDNVMVGHDALLKLGDFGSCRI